MWLMGGAGGPTALGNIMRAQRVATFPKKSIMQMCIAIFHTWYMWDVLETQPDERKAKN
jgi:hypothetical protein